MKRKPAPPAAPAVPAAVAAPLAASLPTAYQPGRAAAGPARLEAELWQGRERALAKANARAEHWAAQADRLARQVERMREAMEYTARDMETSDINSYLITLWAERLRAAAKGGDDE